MKHNLGKAGYLKKDKLERYNTRRAWFVKAWRIVNDKGQDMVQPWFNTKTEARKYAKETGLKLIEGETA